MKRKFLIFMMMLILLPSMFVLTGCDITSLFKRKLIYYQPRFPEDSYEAEMSHHLGNYDMTWSVIHRRETFGEIEHYVHYLHYTCNELDSDYFKEYEYLGVYYPEMDDGIGEWIVYVPNEENVWVKGTQSNRYGTDRYYFGSYGDDFWRLLKSADGRGFRKSDKTNETDEYIEYSNGGDVFRISNDIYQLCLYLDYGSTDEVHECTFTANNSTTAIPYFSTLVLED